MISDNGLAFSEGSVNVRKSPKHWEQNVHKMPALPVSSLIHYDRRNRRQQPNKCRTYSHRVRAIKKKEQKTMR